MVMCGSISAEDLLVIIWALCLVLYMRMRLIVISVLLRLEWSMMINYFCFKYWILNLPIIPWHLTLRYFILMELSLIQSGHILSLRMWRYLWHIPLSITILVWIHVSQFQLKTYANYNFLKLTMALVESSFLSFDFYLKSFII